MYRFFKTCQKLHLICLIKFDKMKKVQGAIFVVFVPNSVFKGVFSMSYCCYNNLLCHENDNNVLFNDWAVCRYHDCSCIE